MRRTLSKAIAPEDQKILTLLIKIRFLAFAFLTAPIVSLIPFVLTGKQQLGLASFGIGTISILFWLSLFKKKRSEENPIRLIYQGTRATILVNVILGLLLLYGSYRGIESQSLMIWYLLLQLVSGIPFALINGVDSKLSSSIFRAIAINSDEVLSPNVEFRRCRAAGSTMATAVGAFIWSLVILFWPNAQFTAACYSIIFALGIAPSLFLLRYLRQLDQTVQGCLPAAEEPETNSRPPVNKEHGNEIRQSIMAIGCLEGLLQFSQFYFSLRAIKILFSQIPNWELLVFVIPLTFYAVNALEQIGASLFSRYQARSLRLDSAKRSETLGVRQRASLVTLVIVVAFFVEHSALGYFLNWWMWLDVFAYGFFNIVKGFAGGLAEQWNEAIGAHYKNHDEARFSTNSALLGRVTQVLSIAVFYAFNWRMNAGSFDDLSPTSKAMTGTLTVWLFFLLTVNLYAFSKIDHGKESDRTWTVLVKAMVNREERTALFTQLLRVLFVASLILSNLLALKVIRFEGLIFTHGSVFYVMLFVLINLIAVFETSEAAIKTVFLGAISYFFVFIALLLSTRAPGALTVSTKVISSDSYNYLFGSEIAWLFFISFLGYAFTIPLDVRLVSFLKRFPKLNPLVTGVAATFISQLIDTFIFVYGGYFFWRAATSDRAVQLDLGSMLFGQFALKFSVYLVMYSPLYLAIKFFRKWMGGVSVAPSETTA